MNEMSQAKVDVLCAFARGPGIMLNEDERNERIASLLGIIESEFSVIVTGGAVASVSQISGRTVRVSLIGETEHVANSRINWAQLMMDLRQNPGTSKTLVYDSMRTAVSTASRQQVKYPDFTFMTERRGDAGAVILTYEPSAH